jgi:hypothetical protein
MCVCALAFVGASIYCAHTRRPSRSRQLHACFWPEVIALAPASRVFLAGGHRTRASLRVFLAGGHRSSVELRPSRNPSLKSSEMMPSWGITPPPTSGHFGDVPSLVRSLFTSPHGLPTVTKIARRAYTLASPTFSSVLVLLHNYPHTIFFAAFSLQYTTLL